MGTRILITGMRGTVAPVIAGHLRRYGAEVLAWDRQAVPETDASRWIDFLARVDPDKVFHIGMGPPEWAASMAQWCADFDRRFVFTSTASVYSANMQGPITVAGVPDATDDYGRYKRSCEEAIHRANPDALTVRLGWQIGHEAGSNNMFDYFERHAQHGALPLSERWFPACSFLDDTAAALLELEQRSASGVFLLDGNPGLSLYGIGTALSRLHGGRWRVRPTSEPARNNLMRDERVNVRPITDRLGPCTMTATKATS